MNKKTDTFAEVLSICCKIFHSLILSIIGLAFIGVNVSKLHCRQCEKVYLQIQVMPQEETKSPCAHECDCCNKDAGERDDRQHNQPEHQFYKITDPSQTEKIVECLIVFCWLDNQLLFEPVLNIMPEWLSAFGEDDSPDPSFPFSFLCIYKC